MGCGKFGKGGRNMSQPSEDGFEFVRHCLEGQNHRENKELREKEIKIKKLHKIRERWRNLYL